jgi:hypothetical protein
MLFDKFRVGINRRMDGGHLAFSAWEAPEGAPCSGGNSRVVAGSDIIGAAARMDMLKYFYRM